MSNNNNINIAQGNQEQVVNGNQNYQPVNTGVNPIPPIQPVVPPNQEQYVQNQNVSSIATPSMAQEIVKMLELNNNMAAEKNLKMKKEEESRVLFETQGNAGKASSVFADKMQQEIAEGRCFNYYYSPTLARTRGMQLDFVVNGYTIHLQAGYDTVVPLCLQSDLRLFVEGRNLKLSTQGILPGNKSTADSGLTATEQAFIDSYKA